MLHAAPVNAKRAVSKTAEKVGDKFYHCLFLKAARDKSVATRPREQEARAIDELIKRASGLACEPRCLDEGPPLPFSNIERSLR